MNYKLIEMVSSLVLRFLIDAVFFSFPFVSFFLLERFFNTIVFSVGDIDSLDR